MKSYKVDHAIVTPYHVGKNISKNVYNSWMLYYARGHYVRSHIAEISASERFLIDSQIDIILNNANHLDYVIVTWFGTYMDDMWNWHDDCIEYIEQLNKNKWLFSCQIIDKEKQKKNINFANQFYPYPICTFINLKTWREIGKPKWGDWNKDKEVKIIKPIPSKECIHDDYTPLQIESSNELVTIKNQEHGWNFINESLKNNLVIKNIPVKLRKGLLHTYPENYPEGWNNIMEKFMNVPMIDNWDEIDDFKNNLKNNFNIHDDKITQLLTHLSDVKSITHGNRFGKGIFFIYNTEEIIPSQEVYNECWPNIDTIIGPCSMFKAFILGSYKSGYIKNYIHYDIYQRNVDYKKFITENWNGTYNNLHDVLKKLDVDSYHYWTTEKNILDKVWTLLEKYLGQENITQSWIEYKNASTHSYILSNALHDDKKIIQQLQKISPKGIYTGLGDIPGFKQNILTYGIDNINKLVIQHIENLESLCDNVFVDIKLPKNDEQHLLDSKKIKNMLTMTEDYYFEYKQYSS